MEFHDFLQVFLLQVFLFFLCKMKEGKLDLLNWGKRGLKTSELFVRTSLSFIACKNRQLLALEGKCLPCIVAIARQFVKASHMFNYLMGFCFEKARIYLVVSNSNVWQIITVYHIILLSSWFDFLLILASLIVTHAHLGNVSVLKLVRWLTSLHKEIFIPTVVF